MKATFRAEYEVIFAGRRMARAHVWAAESTDAQRELLRNQAGAAISRSPDSRSGGYAALGARADAATPWPELHCVDAPPLSEPAQIQCTVSIRLPVKV